MLGLGFLNLRFWWKMYSYLRVFLAPESQRCVKRVLSGLRARAVLCTTWLGVYHLLPSSIIARPCSTIEKFNNFRALVFFAVAWTNVVALSMLAQGHTQGSVGPVMVLSGWGVAVRPCPALPCPARPTYCTAVLYRRTVPPFCDSEQWQNCNGRWAPGSSF